LIPRSLLSQKRIRQQGLPRDRSGQPGVERSSFVAVFSLSQLLGLLLSGALANSIGVRHLFTSSAVLLVVLSGIGFLWLRDVVSSSIYDL
jgi:hypothetical protein